MKKFDLRLVEIELFTFCNRKCDWCPNKYIDRSYFDLYQFNLIKLAEELRDLKYDKYISFSRYNEPFAIPGFLDFTIQIIKHYLPYCTYVSNTNGDYLNEEIIKNSELDEITIMDYDNKGIKYCESRLKEWNVDIIDIVNNCIYGKYENKKICYYSDFNKNCKISSRGGSLKKYDFLRNNTPCTEPEYFIGINYDGTVSPCCNIRNDIESHKKFIIGNLNEESLEDILNSPKRIEFIDNCSKGCFGNDYPCITCNNSGGRYTREKGSIVYEHK